MPKKLSDFVIEVSNNPAQIEAFRANPDRLLDKSGLSEEDKLLLKRGEIQGVEEKIDSQEVLSSATGRSAISIIVPREEGLSSATGRSAIGLITPAPERKPDPH
jgi:hypothetical protein